MPPPTIVTRTGRPQAQPRACAVASTRSASARDERRVAADGAGPREVHDARLLGALLVEDVDLLERLDVLARERDRDDDDRRRLRRRQLVEHRFGRRPQPALRSHAALEAEAGARADVQAPGHRLDGDAHVVEIGIAALDVRLGQPVRREQHRRRRPVLGGQRRDRLLDALDDRAHVAVSVGIALDRGDLDPAAGGPGRLPAGSATIRWWPAIRAGTGAAPPRGRSPAAASAPSASSANGCHAAIATTGLTATPRRASSAATASACAVVSARIGERPPICWYAARDSRAAPLRDRARQQRLQETQPAQLDDVGIAEEPAQERLDVIERVRPTQVHHHEADRRARGRRGGRLCAAARGRRVHAPLTAATSASTASIGVSG